MVFWAGALAIGVVSVGFAVLADHAQLMLAAALSQSGNGQPFFPLLVTPLSFVLCAYLSTVFFLGSQGSGIPQAIAARHLRDDQDRNHILSLKIVAGEIALTFLGLL